MLPNEKMTGAMTEAANPPPIVVGPYRFKCWNSCMLLQNKKLEHSPSDQKDTCKRDDEARGKPCRGDKCPGKEIRPFAAVELLLWVMNARGMEHEAAQQQASNHRDGGGNSGSVRTDGLHGLTEERVFEPIFRAATKTT